MSPARGIPFLHSLAGLYGIQTAYYDVNHHRQPTSTESLLAILRSLGAPVAAVQDVPPAWRERRQLLWQRLLEPVVIAWNNIALIQVRLPALIAGAIFDCHLKLESGEEYSWQWPGADQPVVDTAEIEGTHYVVKQLRPPTKLPWGYHRFTLEMAGKRAESLLVSAPLRAYLPAVKKDSQMWGGFLPLYALHTDNSLGAGDFSDLEALAAWLGERGGQVVATLPLLASFLNDVFAPSPYLPASRLLWNEFYLDINNVPELQKCPSAQALLHSSSFRKEIAALRSLSLVDYRRQMAMKRRLLEGLCRCFFAEPSRGLDALQHFTDMNPVVADYARFRATGEKQGVSWRSWPQPLRDGVLTEADYDEENRRYHLYTQWLAHKQIESISRKIKQDGLRLYLDLPLGVHPEGYDVWREREAFIPDTAAGAPPDAVFTRGQNWEFPPLHPERIRERGYRYVIACLRHHLQRAAILRIDHVMGLHRLFCIPNGMEAAQGVYVRYRAEELYAILALESHRHKAIIVGEDLGTVPPYVRPAMKRHNFQRMYVLHYELASDPRKGLLPVSSNSVASLNTHDMPPFAAFWQGLDIAQREKLGLLDKEGARKERETRRRITATLSTALQQRGWLEKAGVDTFSALKASLSFLASSQAWIVLVNLEDLWLENKPQNVPSTKEEYPNWRHRAQYSLERVCQMPQVVDTLHTINLLRKKDRNHR
ncbi:4-alpha-glucanotransferase [Chloroflexota bacterium]